MKVITAEAAEAGLLWRESCWPLVGVRCPWCRTRPAEQHPWAILSTGTYLWSVAACHVCWQLRAWDRP